MELIPLPQTLSVCRLSSITDVPLLTPPAFLGITADEVSLVCETARVPACVTERDDGWRAFRIAGTLDFALTGILAGVADALRDAQIPIFAVSTFDTDYVLTKADRFASALDVLMRAGYAVREA